MKQVNPKSLANLALSPRRQPRGQKERISVRLSDRAIAWLRSQPSNAEAIERLIGEEIARSQSGKEEQESLS